MVNIKNKKVNIKYKIKTASTEEIFTFLFQSKDDFIPPLHETVNLNEYSGKISERALTFEAWDNGQMIGLVAAYFNDPEGRTGFITSINIIKDYMGKGIATKLMNMCLTYGRQNNFKEIELEVNSKNKKAIKLYEKFGFLESGNTDEDRVMKLKLR